MNRQMLWDNISALNRKSVVEKLTVEDVLSVAPHLERSEVCDLLKQVEPGATIMFIGPPVLVRGFEHVYALNRQGKHITMHHAGGYKRGEAFLGYRPQMPVREYDFRERVANYAEVNYGQHLVWDRFFQVIAYRILTDKQNKAIEAAAGYKATFGVMERMANELPLPMLQVLDMQLETVGTDSITSFEISTGHTPILAPICGICGDAVNKGTCLSCHKTYPDREVEWQYPLHTMLRLNSLLKEPVTQAIKRHYRDWGCKGLVTKQNPTDKRLPRAITVEEK